jgi:hypothetical protein
VPQLINSKATNLPFCVFRQYNSLFKNHPQSIFLVKDIFLIAYLFNPLFSINGGVAHILIFSGHRIKHLFLEAQLKMAFLTSGTMRRSLSLSLSLSRLKT